MQTVWVVTIDEVVGFQKNGYSPKVFSTEKLAKEYFDEEVKQMKKELPMSWTREDTSTSFEMYESGDWDNNHSVISMESVVVDERVAR